MEEAAILIKNYLNSQISEINITAKTDLTGGIWRLTCNAPLTIKQYDKVTVGTVTYRVDASQFKTYVDVEADAEPTGDTLKKTLNIYIGTHLSADFARSEDLDSSKDLKFPFAVILEPAKNKLTVDQNLPYGKSSIINLVLMDEAKPDDWTTQNHYDYAIKPMVRWAELLLETMQDKMGGELNLVSIFDYENKINWSVLAKFPETKAAKKLFKEDNSGIDCVIDFEIGRQNNIIGCLH